jgi:hypothetical protein
MSAWKRLRSRSPTPSVTDCSGRRSAKALSPSSRGSGSMPSVSIRPFFFRPLIKFSSSSICNLASSTGASSPVILFNSEPSEFPSKSCAPRAAMKEGTGTRTGERPVMLDSLSSTSLTVVISAPASSSVLPDSRGISTALATARPTSSNQTG